LDWKKLTPYFIPSIACVLFVFVFLTLSFSGKSSLLNDGDTGFHLRIGEYIITNLSIPRDDPFSFISPPLFFTAHEWLSAVVMETANRIYGLNGVVLLFSVIISLTYSLLFKLFFTRTDNIIAAVAIILLVTVSCKIHWLARPHTFSLLFMVIWYYLLHKNQTPSGKRQPGLYFMPLIMLLWVNMHGGFLTGFILNAAYILGNLLELSCAPKKTRTGLRKKIRDLSLVTFFCILVCFANPYGWHMLIFPFKFIGQQFMTNFINEFKSPDFHSFSLSFFKYLLLISITLLAVSQKRVKLPDLILILIFLSMSLQSVRYVPLFCIALFPISLELIRPLVENPETRAGIFIRTKAESIAQTDANAKGFLWPALAAAIVFSAMFSGYISHGFNPERKPLEAMKFINKEKIPGNMFNNYEFGDFVIYSAWPHYKVFIDGRADMYGNDRLKEYAAVIFAGQGWEKIIEKHKITWLILNTTSPLSPLVWVMPEWKMIYGDKVANIFLKDIPENRELIDRYPNVEPVELETED